MSYGDFKESTIVATMWLIVHQPSDLAEFLRTHPPGQLLEKIARGRIAENIERRKMERA